LPPAKWCLCKWTAAEQARVFPFYSYILMYSWKSNNTVSSWRLNKKMSGKMNFAWIFKIFNEKLCVENFVSFLKKIHLFIRSQKSYHFKVSTLCSYFLLLKKATAKFIKNNKMFVWNMENMVEVFSINSLY
jgi:hypothetical protein